MRDAEYRSEESLTYIQGRADLSDGEWVWPTGLAHYVERHSICLPESFLKTMMSNAWTIPSHTKDGRSVKEIGYTSYQIDRLPWVIWSSLIMNEWVDAINQSKRAIPTM